MLEVKIFGVDGDILIEELETGRANIKILNSEGIMLAEETVYYDDLERAIIATKHTES